MKVKCKINKLSEIKNRFTREWLKKDYIHMDDNEILGIEIGKEYIVQGIVFWENTPWYYIYEENSDDYPMPIYSGFFDVIDQRLSKFWQLDFKIFDDQKKYSALVFKEWADDRVVYERLLDSHPDEIDLFKKYRKLIESEFTE